jgi:stearoyl-CoA desaturase (Delta-9 desaturase)
VVTSLTHAARKKDWTNILFLSITPILAGPVLIAHTVYTGFEIWMPLLFLGMYALVGLSICAGYHRYFSHKSYECASVVQIFYAIFGAMAAQNSILRWSSEHRRHHVHAETDWDPYSITRGFLWAHIVWIFYDDQKSADFKNARDLQRNPIVAWQHRWYKPLLLMAGLGVPTLIGAFLGNALAGLLWGGFLRIVVVHHSTFFVNSLAHTFGKRTYDADATARDNWLVALVTLGEGYHSFHHRFPSDFRNGVRWYQWDPAKWFIKFLGTIGLAKSLRSTPRLMIQHARKHALIRRLEEQFAAANLAHENSVSQQIDRVRDALEQELAAWKVLAKAQKEGLADAWNAAKKTYEQKLQQASLEWNILMETCERPRV